MNSPLRLLFSLPLSVLLVSQFAAAQSARRKSQEHTASAGAFNLPAATFNGSLKEITARAIVLEAEDGQPVTIYRNRKTRFLQGGQPLDAKRIAEGTKLTLDVANNPDGSLLAVNVTVPPAPQKK